MMTTPKRILVSGAGIAGATCALLLATKGHDVTIVERAPALRANGQQVDIDSYGEEIAKLMGLWDDYRERSVDDEGLKFVTGSGRVVAAFGVTKANSKQRGPNNFVKEVEILRGDIVDVLYQKSLTAGVRYLFGEKIEALSERETGATVTLTKLGEREFDVVIIGDGLFSQTRDLVFGKAATKIKPLGQIAALMSIPWKPSDGTWSAWCNFPGGRCVSTRPQAKSGVTGAYLCIMTPDSGKLARLPLQEQKAEFAARFQGFGWETSRIVREMMTAEDFYVGEVAQVHAESLIQGRVALIGDAGYCPSPVSGQGTTLAFVGAYILAGCLNTNENVSDALRQYQVQVKPFVEKGQKLIPGVPGIANPQSQWGIYVLYTLLWVAHWVAKSGLQTVVGKLLKPVAAMFEGETLKLPEY